MKCDNRFGDGIILWEFYFNNMKREREICNFLEAIMFEVGLNLVIQEDRRMELGWHRKDVVIFSRKRCDIACGNRFDRSKLAQCVDDTNREYMRSRDRDDNERKYVKEEKYNRVYKLYDNVEKRRKIRINKSGETMLQKLNFENYRWEIINYKS